MTRGTRWALLGLVVLPLFGAAIGSTAGRLRTPVYRTSMIVDLSRGGQLDPTLPMVRAFLESQVSQLESRRVVELAVEEILALEPRPTHFRNRSGREIIEEIRDSVEAHLQPDSSLVRIQAIGPDPRAVTIVASAVWSSYLRLASDPQRGPVGSVLVGPEVPAKPIGPSPLTPPLAGGFAGFVLAAFLVGVASNRPRKRVPSLSGAASCRAETSRAGGARARAQLR